ncbi:MAG TPA: hypothetical protein VFK72_00070 [Nevskia sp.]|nr:hypothetical protein [Nevskia sp.]
MSEVVNESWWHRTRNTWTLRYRKYRPIVAVLAIAIAVGIVYLVWKGSNALWQQSRKGAPQATLEIAAKNGVKPVTPPKAADSVKMRIEAEAPAATPEPAKPQAVPVTTPPKPAAKSKSVKKAAKHKPEQKPAPPTSPVAKNAKGEYEWRRFGVAPYASSRAAAMAHREAAFRALGVPAGAVKELARVTAAAGKRVRLVNGDRLTAMLSKGGVVHKNVVVRFEKPPISDAMEYAAPAEEWQIDWQGTTYTVILPDVCNNWSVRITTKARPRAPVASAPPVQGDCVEITFSAVVRGRVRWGVATRKGPLPPDTCNAQRQGNGAWLAWYGDCDTCVPPVGLLVPHKFMYGVTEVRQTLRFSKRILEDIVYICLEDDLYNQTCGVYIRPEDWKGRTHIDIPDSMWRVDHGDCP